MSTLIAGTYTGAATKIASAILAGYSTPVANGSTIRSALFSNGEKGIWFDPSDFSTMFQDSTGTTPVTAVGQTVGLILDKSGNGNNATQVTSTKRPVLQIDANGKYYLKFDGVDDFLVTSSIDFSATDKMSVFTGMRKLANTTAIYVELSSNANSNNGSFYLLDPSDTSGNRAAAIRGTVVANAAGRVTIGGSSAAITDVLTASLNLAGTTNTLAVGIRLNGAVPSQTDLNTLNNGGNFGAYPLYIGMRAGTSLPFNGQLYSLIVRGALSDANQIASTETYVNSQTGAY